MTDRTATVDELMTGEEYLESLRDGREVWLHGEKVKDVTTHPAFRNSARSIARLYDTFHDPEQKDKLTAVDDYGIRTHKFYMPSKTGPELLEARNALAEWARMSYGFMGRTPDYKAAFMASLGASPKFYDPYDTNALDWYKRYASKGLFLNHVLVNPPVDRKKPIHEVTDVFIHVVKETDKGPIISGAKMLATGSALTNATFVAQNSSANLEAGKAEDFALVFIAPVDTPGTKLLCRRSYESLANSPFDNPLSSRFDENDAVLIFDNALVPWENFLVYRDTVRANSFYRESGFLSRYNLQAATRLAIKLEFMAGLFQRGIQANGTDEFRGVQVAAGQIWTMRNLLWALTTAMCLDPMPGPGDSVIPKVENAATVRALSTEIWGDVRVLFEQVLGGAPIVIPSGYEDVKHPELEDVIEQFYRGSDSTAHDRIKLFKLIWDAIGSEFGGRHSLYERNYSGNNEQVQLDVLNFARVRGDMARSLAMVEQCMSEYDLNGWTSDTWIWDGQK